MFNPNQAVTYLQYVYMAVCRDQSAGRKPRELGSAARLLRGPRLMLMLIVEMLVLSALVVGLLYVALHPKRVGSEWRNNECSVGPAGEET